MRNNVPFQANIQFTILLVDVQLKFTIRHLVTDFIFAIILVFFLDGIVSQVNKFVVQVVNIKLITAGSDIAFFIDVNFHPSTNGGNHCVCSNVKLTSMDQKWIVNVSLHDASSPVV